MSEIENTQTTIEEPAALNPQQYVYPYSRKQYPYLLLVSFNRPLNKEATALLFECFPRAIITTQGTVIIPRSVDHMTVPLSSALEEVQSLGLIGFVIQDNPQE
ncbi:hypothetical protein [Peromfec virus RodF5_8]|uniref:Uncharacterized protein n=1 Tax=Peromfec virus RodF5_8 TaxID=2929344 RepID=A0A976N259_9VIRU|nr:hypothetical protein [Peromfec virus RodF5_8]